MEEPVFLIAEAGINHNGHVDLGLEMIEVAARAGVDAIKFQTFTATALATPSAETVSYQRGMSRASTQRELLAELELDLEAHQILAQSAKQKGLLFLSTAFDIVSLKMLDDLQIPILKVPSGELTNLPYLRHIASRSKPVFLSTGMSRLSEVETALNTLEDSGLGREMVTVLHCTSCYPTDYPQVNLRVLKTLRESLTAKVGYSDHTLGHQVACAAVALGATVLEKHFTLDRSLPGPDHQASATPDELHSYVEAVRDVESALGVAVKEPQPCEQEALIWSRKSIVTSRQIRAGEVFSPENLTTKRPGTGLSPTLWDRIMGETALRDYDEDEVLDP